MPYISERRVIGRFPTMLRKDAKPVTRSVMEANGKFYVYTGNSSGPRDVVNVHLINGIYCETGL